MSSTSELTPGLTSFPRDPAGLQALENHLEEKNLFLTLGKYGTWFCIPAGSLFNSAEDIGKAFDVHLNLLSCAYHNLNRKATALQEGISQEYVDLLERKDVAKSRFEGRMSFTKGTDEASGVVVDWVRRIWEADLPEPKKSVHEKGRPPRGQFRPPKSKAKRSRGRPPKPKDDPTSAAAAQQGNQAAANAGSVVAANQMGMGQAANPHLAGGIPNPANDQQAMTNADGMVANQTTGMELPDQQQVVDNPPLPPGREDPINEFFYHRPSDWNDSMDAADPMETAQPVIDPSLADPQADHGCG